MPTESLTIDATRSDVCSVQHQVQVVAYGQEWNISAAWTRLRPNGGRYVCPDCKKAFINRCDLECHVQTHTCDRLFHCHLCPKVFNLKGITMAHLQCHTGDKPYKRLLCNMVSSWRSSLVNHRKLHGLSMIVCAVAVEPS
ncbi:hypothetical protein HPB50_026076 [Hyalomma asiaticum]|uniref:Uncharacterized protein n=1 Tax=Hyalomma asiaticum TaxID=266040 RepID=A0ACB7RN66_HYAAI|nr:hypothetical protein HPB50_026076 [Hyalomma asiaticum]